MTEQPAAPYRPNPSTADLKSLHCSQRALPRDLRSKAVLALIFCQCPLLSEVRMRSRGDV